MRLKVLDAERSRLVLVTAAAGYGKTSWVRSLLRDRTVDWYCAADAAEALRDLVGGRARGGAPIMLAGTTPHWLVLDEPSLSAGQLGELLSTALAMPSGPRIAVITRLAPEFPAAGRPAAAALVEVGPAQLALCTSAAVRLLHAEHGLSEFAGASLARATAGWPALLHLAGRAMARAPQPAVAEQSAVAAPPGERGSLRRLAGPGTSVFEYVMREIWPGLSAEARDLLELVSRTGSAAAGPGRFPRVGRADAALVELVRGGLVVPTGPESSRHRPVPLLAAVIGGRPSRSSQPSQIVRRWSVKAAARYTAAGRYPAAAAAQREAGRERAAARIADTHAERILACDGPIALAALVESLPERLRTDALREVHGEALALAGDSEGARAQYGLLAGGSSPRLSPGLARRLGCLDMRAGEPRAALHVFARGLDGDGLRAEHALLTAWISLAYCAAGAAEDAADAAARAHQAASILGEYRAAIAGHVASGLAAEVRGESPASRRHYTAALEIAVANGDAIREAAVGTVYARRLLGEGRPAEALAAASRSVYLAETTGLRVVLGVALAVAGSALHRLGRLDEALDRLDRAVAVERRMGSPWLAHRLVGIGAVHHVRGSVRAARAAYEEAARIATDAGDPHALVPALSGQALLLADEEPGAAAQAAEQALRHARGPMRAEALLAVGHAVRGAGDVAGAARIAQESAAHARLYRDRVQLARALELSAATASQPRAARRALSQALHVWQELGDGPAADRVRATLGAREDAGGAERVAGRLARDRLSAAGIASPADPACAAGAGEVRINALGRLAVLIDGEPVPAAAWQSRKARGLLRILIARRGRAVPREQIAHLLWGESSGPVVGHRLSVALSTVRSVLDPGRRHEAAYFIISDSGSIALDTSRVAVDVEHFLARAEHGLRLHESGERAQALEVLTAAQLGYTGDFLEDEPYDDWTVALRETARATYLQCARVLAGLHRGLGDTAGALRYLYRVLDKDPYDERCYREIIDTLEAAGSHGEARRARERYAAAMQSLNLEDW